MKNWINFLVFLWTLKYDDPLLFWVYVAGLLLLFGLGFLAFSIDTSSIFPYLPLAPWFSFHVLYICIYT